MDVPHVPRVTVPGEPTRNGHAPCQGCMDPPPLNVVGRIETLTDVVATANRSSLALVREVEALRFALIFAGVFLASYLIYKMEA